MDTVPLSFIIITIVIIAVIAAAVFYYLKKRKGNEYTEEDVISMVAEGQEQGNILASEAEMIQNIFEFDEKDAKDIMINRTGIVAIDGESTLRETIDCFNENRVSRIPVYMEDLDNIIGIVHIKDVLKYSVKPELYDNKIHELPELMIPAEFVPETHGINTLFTQMQIKKSHMVIVVDEYGQTAGIVTMEDLLEEIVGNILDEYDEDVSQIRVQGDNTYICAGLAPLSEVGEKLGIEFPDEGYETLNGFMTDRLGHVPKTGEDFETEYGGYRFRIAYVKGRVIQSVRCTRIPAEGAEPVDPGPGRPAEA